MNQLFEGVFGEGKKLYVLNSLPQQRLFDEEIIADAGKEYRNWSPLRSKLAAAIVKGRPELPISSSQKSFTSGQPTATQHLSSQT